MKKLKSILRSPEVKKYFFNTSWMMGEKIFTMSFAVIVSIFVARYLGANDYGLLAYAISITSLFAIATHMGLSGLAVRELVNNPNDQNELLGTIFGIKFFGAVVSTLGVLGFVALTVDLGNTEFWILIITSGTILINPFEVFDFWFQAKVQAKYSSIVRASATISTSVLQLGLVFFKAKLIAFAGAYLLQAVITAILFLFFFTTRADHSFLRWKFNFGQAKKLFSQSWMIMLAAIFGIIYLKMDQVMLKWLVNAKEVGVYSVAAKLSEAWYFIPNMIVASLFPKLLELKKRDQTIYNKRLQQLFDLLFFIAFVLAVVVTFISEPVISILYGMEYEKAALILSIHIWAGVFIFMRAAFSKWILVEDAIPFSLISQGTGAGLNILLNLVLIPLYGGVGAAVATIISYAGASYLILAYFSKSRPIFTMMSRSLLLPLRFLKVIK